MAYLVEVLGEYPHSCGQTVLAPLPEESNEWYRALLSHVADCPNTSPELRAEVVIDLARLGARS